MSGDKDIDDEIGAQDEILDDDYGDAAGDDEEFADEDWDSYDEEGGDGGDEDAAPRKKGMPKFNKILIAGALGVGLCVVAFTMLTSKPAPTPPGQQRPAAQAQQGASGDIQRQRLNSASLSDSAPTTQRDVIYGRNREENVIAPVNDNVGDQGGLLNDPAEVQKIEEYRAQLEEDLEVGQTEEEAAQSAVVTSDPGQDLPAATPQVVSQEPPMPVPGADSVLTPLPDATAPVAAADDAASVGLPRAQDLTLSDGAPATAPETPVAVDAAAESAAAVPVPAAPSADVAALTEKIEALQGDLDTQVAKVKELESTVQQLERALESRVTEAPRAASPAKRKPASSAAGATARKSAAPVRWVLKSAQPGHAMVSRAGENEMRNITVGDTLPGVGRVTQIYQSPTGWIVQGTDGRILQ